MRWQYRNMVTWNGRPAALPSKWNAITATTSNMNATRWGGRWPDWCMVAWIK
jgi:hypothetical protein